ncbi:MAG: response regulator [Candidatus Omnitrophota bacterium]|nr:response regulator [Candidatus Omnitrophota bacterium]
MKEILVVDDEIGVREAFRTILKDDYHVLIAENGEQAIELLKVNKNIRLVILDIILPGISGIEVLKQIKKINLGLPTMIVTATRNEQSLTEAMQLGAVSYITKPFGAKQVKEIIQNTVN